jgi:ABC-type sugar transport system ATPase subunit
MRDQPDTDAPFLRLSGVHKRYGGVTALDGVDFAFTPCWARTVPARAP